MTRRAQPSPENSARHTLVEQRYLCSWSWPGLARLSKQQHQQHQPSRDLVSSKAGHWALVTPTMLQCHVGARAQEQCAKCTFVAQPGALLKGRR
jgi:hypothetical protein